MMLLISCGRSIDNVGSDNNDKKKLSVRRIVPTEHAPVKQATEGGSQRLLAWTKKLELLLFV